MLSGAFFGVYGLDSYMSLGDLRKIISRQDPFPSVRALLEGQARLISVEEIAPDAKPVFAATVTADEPKTTVILAYSEDEAERLYEGLITFGVPEARICLVPAADAGIFDDGAPDWGAIGARIRALTMLSVRDGGVIVLPISAALAVTVERSAFAAAVQVLKKGQEMDIGEAGMMLAKGGYRRADLVTELGEFSLRGGLVDVWPPTESTPIRIELFGDEIDSIRRFDAESQRSTETLQDILIPPAREGVLADNFERAASELEAHLEEQTEALRAQGHPDEAESLETKVNEHLFSIRQGTAFNGLEYYLPALVKREVCLLDWLPRDALVLWDEPNLTKGSWERIWQELLEVKLHRASRGQALALEQDHFVAIDHGRQEILKRRSLIFSSLPHASSWLQTPHRIQFQSAGMETFGSQVQVFAENAATWMEHGFRIVLVTPQVLRMGEMLRELDLRPIHGELHGEIEDGITVLEGNIATGFRLPAMKLIVVSEHDIFGTQTARRPRPSRRESRPIHSVADIKEGDFIVHIHHGIGVYKGLVTRTDAFGTRDYLHLEYAGGDKLYVPADQTDRVQKYTGSESGPPTVHRLGGSDWARTKRKVKESVKQMAKELLQIYAAREALGGHSYGPDTPWQSEMEQAFPYRETQDQMRAIKEVKKDLEKAKPMDRLICGDVGFGKTEVAIRAAFKVVLEGRQVAVLCPTTVLAQQHHNTFNERLAAFPVRCEMLSRFRTPKEQRAILEDMRAGNVDIVIGTHRLLGKDVEFKDLGLIIVDEEHRFGVSHKERLKQMRVSVDVLTLTATPIPRTLHMSLAGIRDMSVINQAPEGRMPVRTYVREFDDDLVREAIVREMDRDGQVFFVHNRVESIHMLADRISNLVPYARVAIGHGQMSESELEKVMYDFYHNKYDILLCTTIIESGLDIPNANTIIINNADKLGLAQLYQLRGRVGRSDRQAYAYLLYKSELVLTESAEHRLAAIREFADLGSGFKIAMRDMEIRGAGNLLGPEQHGQMVSVGFDMYCSLLSQAVKELKGEPEQEERTLPKVELPVEAYIPSDYVPGENQRIAIYRKMASQYTEKDVTRLEEELDDRFGPPPASVRNALAILRLRVQAEQIGVSSIGEESGRLSVVFKPGVVIEPVALRQFMRTMPDHWWESTRVRMKLDGANPIESVSEFLRLVGRSLIKPGKEGVVKKRKIVIRRK